MWPCAQSPLPAQGAVLQAPAAQAKGEQLVVAPAVQLAFPLHVEAAVRFPLPLHAAGAQTVPAGTGAQLPAEPATAQEVQLGQLAEPQHAPSTQWPLTHWGSM